MKRLSEAAVRQIARMIADGAGTNAQIAALFGVGEVTISGIRSGRTYSKITGIRHSPKRRDVPRRKATDRERDRIAALAGEGMTAKEIHTVMSRQAGDCGDRPIGYDTVCRTLRTLRSLGVVRYYKSPKTPGRPLGDRGYQADIPPYLRAALREAGERRKGLRMRPGEIRAILRTILRNRPRSASLDDAFAEAVAEQRRVCEIEF